MTPTPEQLLARIVASDHYAGPPALKVIILAALREMEAAGVAKGRAVNMATTRGATD